MTTEKAQKILASLEPWGDGTSAACVVFVADMRELLTDLLNARELAATTYSQAWGV